MTIRQMIKILADAEDLGATIYVRTHDGAQLGGVCALDTGEGGRTDDPRIVLLDSSSDVARVAAEHVLRQADGDPATLAKLREAGVIS